MNERLARLEVRLVRLGVPAVLLAGVLAVPLGLAVLGEERERRGGDVGVDVMAMVLKDENTGDKVHDEMGNKPLLNPEVHAARSRVEEIRVMEREELLDLARAGSTQERLAAVNVLWARGDRGDVEALAVDGDRLMVAKVKAFKAQRRY